MTNSSFATLRSPGHREKHFNITRRMPKFPIKNLIFRRKFILVEKKSSKIFENRKNPKFYNVDPTIKISDFSIFPKKRIFGHFRFFRRKSVRKIIFGLNKFSTEKFLFYWKFWHSSRYIKVLLPMPRRLQTRKTTICHWNYSESVKLQSKISLISVHS